MPNLTKNISAGIKNIATETPSVRFVERKTLTGFFSDGVTPINPSAIRKMDPEIFLAALRSLPKPPKPLPRPKPRVAFGISSGSQHKRMFKTNHGYNLAPNDGRTGAASLCREALMSYLNKNASCPYDEKLDNPNGRPFVDLDGIYSWTNPDASKDCPDSNVAYREGPKTKEWMDQREKNYLARIAKEEEAAVKATEKARAELAAAAKARVVEKAKAEATAKAAEAQASEKAKLEAATKAFGIYYSQGKWNDAFKEVDNCIAAGLGGCSFYFSRGHANARLGNKEAAKNDYAKSLELAAPSEKYYVYYQQGMGLGLMNDNVAAINAFHEVIRLNKDYAYGYGKLGLHYCLAKDYKSSVFYFEKFKTLQPSYPDWKIYSDEAEKKWAEEKAKAEAQQHFDLARQFYEKADYLTALKEIEEALRPNPEFGEAYCLRGTCYRDLNKLPEALTAYEKSIALNKNSCWVYHNRSLAYTKLNEHQKALADAEKFVELAPGNPSGKAFRDTAKKKLTEEKAATAQAAEKAQQEVAAKAAEKLKLEAAAKASEKKKQKLEKSIYRFYQSQSPADANNTDVVFRSEAEKSSAIVLK